MIWRFMRSSVLGYRKSSTIDSLYLPMGAVHFFGGTVDRHPRMGPRTFGEFEALHSPQVRRRFVDGLFSPKILNHILANAGY
jgi:hypothetical protein